MSHNSNFSILDSLLKQIRIKRKSDKEDLKQTSLWSAIWRKKSRAKSALADNGKCYSMHQSIIMSTYRLAT